MSLYLRSEMNMTDSSAGGRKPVNLPEKRLAVGKLRKSVNVQPLLLAIDEQNDEPNGQKSPVSMVSR
jgi:hypothetical protein